LLKIDKALQRLTREFQKGNVAVRLPMNYLRGIEKKKGGEGEIPDRPRQEGSCEALGAAHLLIVRRREEMICNRLRRGGGSWPGRKREEVQSENETAKADEADIRGLLSGMKVLLLTGY
jgi:hypothetical protein